MVYFLEAHDDMKNNLTTNAHHVSSQINTEDGDCSQGQWNVSDNKEKEGGNLWNVAGQSVSNGLLQVIEDQTTWKEKQPR